VVIIIPCLFQDFTTRKAISGYLVENFWEVEVFNKIKKREAIE